MGLCCVWNYLTGFSLALMSGWMRAIIYSSILWIPVCAALFYLLGVWIRSRKTRLLPHLSDPSPGGKPPVTIGFFHPYCNAGGGGERVLWVAIRALQNRFPDVRCVVYTGDTDASRDQILQKARHRFNVVLPRTSSAHLEFVFLRCRGWVEAAHYPFLTLLGQSLGSAVLGMEALLKFVPDVYIDSMGYAFTLPLFKYLGGCAVGCYVHYPTISTDMLDKVSRRSAGYNNATFISRSAVLSSVKLLYYRLFAHAYGVAGRRSDAVMVNSSWTHGHVVSLWGVPGRTAVVYPPCDTEEFLAAPLARDDRRELHTVVSVGQFRPEKDHALQVRAFHAFLEGLPGAARAGYRLVIVGSCRNAEDLARVEGLRTLATSLDIEQHVDFKLNVAFGELKQLLCDATIGLHTMWNEHFGIGVVEMMAAGAVTLAHDSGGPRMDIVTPYKGHPTGFLANDVTSYAHKMAEIFALGAEGRLLVRQNARASVHRFSEENFESGFLRAASVLMSHLT